MKYNRAWWWILIVGSHVCACGDDADSALDVQTCEVGGAMAVGSAGRLALPTNDPLFRPQRPDDATFCKIEMGVSTTDEVQAVLGKPRFSNDSGNGNSSFTYDYAGDQTLRMAFRQGRLHDASVQNMPYPACWGSR